jgi:Holliday junction resolvase
MKESKKQKQMIDALEVNGCYVVKVISATKAGVLDIIFCYKGRFCSVEVKGPNGKASALQLYNRKKIIEAGGKAIIGKTVKEVVALLC